MTPDKLTKGNRNKNLKTFNFLQVFNEAVLDGTFPKSDLPVAEILVLTGFLMIYLMEEVMHFILVKYGNLGRSAAS